MTPIEETLTLMIIGAVALVAMIMWIVDKDFDGMGFGLFGFLMVKGLNKLIKKIK